MSMKRTEIKERDLNLSEVQPPTTGRDEEAAATILKAQKQECHVALVLRGSWDLVRRVISTLS